ncbi:MAG: HAMP domain-containing sensor histidine kinase [Gammaproteobacteria bacterium]|nr:HAMP domain-containing sensor histidine kinase [Gammaproteobacteria bacterium]
MQRVKGSGTLLMVGLFILTGGFMTALLGTSLIYGNRMITTYGPLIDASMEIKLEITAAHLWFEEIISGDRHESMDDVRDHLDTADWYVTSMLEGGRNTHGKYRPLTDENMRQEIKQVKRKLSYFRQVTEQRFRNRASSIAGTDIDQVYDSVFNDLLEQADSVEHQLQQQIDYELAFFNYLIQGLILMVAIAVIAVSLLFFRYHRRQEQHSRELKTANQKMNQLLEHLEDEVSERTHELYKANKRLQELDHLKSMFIASMSHELSTPLNTIIDSSDLILQDQADPLSEQQQEHLKKIDKSGRYLLSMISDILEISKLEAGQLEAEPSTFKLHEMLNEAIEKVHAELEAKGLSLHASFPDNVEMLTDRRHLFQCVLNLLSNAIKYSDYGEVRLSTRVDGPSVEIAVEDDGRGIDRLDMQRLFQPFERILQRGEKGLYGSGLGLYLTKKLTSELLKGNISAESQVGIGSRFTLRVPLHLIG